MNLINQSPFRTFKLQNRNTVPTKLYELLNPFFLPKYAWNLQVPEFDLHRPQQKIATILILKMN
jgi:hypothetical protein